MSESNSGSSIDSTHYYQPAMSVVIDPNNAMQVDVTFSGHAAGVGDGLLMLNNNDHTGVYIDATTGSAFWISPDMRDAMFDGNPQMVSFIPGLGQDAAELADGGITVGDFAGASLNDGSTVSAMAAIIDKVVGIVAGAIAGYIADKLIDSTRASLNATLGAGPATQVDFGAVTNALGGIDLFGGINTSNQGGGMSDFNIEIKPY